MVKCLFQFEGSPVYDFFSGDIFELFCMPFSRSEFAGCKNIHVYILREKKIDKSLKFRLGGGGVFISTLKLGSLCILVSEIRFFWHFVSESGLGEKSRILSDDLWREN